MTNRSYPRMIRGIFGGWLLHTVICCAQISPGESRNVGRLTGGQQWLGFRSSKQNVERVLILGSSTAAGAGASSYQRAWAGILAEKLGPLGGLLINSSVGGSTARETRERFESEFNRTSPDAVVFATNPYNSPNLMLPETVVHDYLSETKELVRLAANAGSIPVVITPYGYQNPGGALASAMLRLRDELEELGCIVWDFWHSTSLENGQWIPGLNFDVLHPNDRGHQAMAESISVPQLMFGRTYYGQLRQSDGEPVGITPYLGGGRSGLLVCRLGQIAQSWTVSLRLRSRDVGLGYVRLLLGKNMPYEVNVAEDGLQLSSGWLNWPVKAEPQHGSTMVSVSFEAVERIFSVYVDGRVLQRTKVERSHAIEELSIEADCEKCVIDELLVHFSAQAASRIDSMHSGLIPRASIGALVRFDAVGSDIIGMQLVPSGASVALDSDTWKVWRARGRSNREGNE